MKHVVADLSNGLSDQTTGDSPVAIEHLNFNIKEDGSVAVRDGSDLTLARLPGGNHRVAWMGKFEDYIFAVQGKEVYVWKDTAWVTIVPYGLTAVSVFPYGDYDSVVSAALVGRDLVLCLSPSVADPLDCNIPMRIIWDDCDSTYAGLGGWWTSTPLGLPPMSEAYSSVNEGANWYQATPSVPDAQHTQNYLFNFGACFYYTLTSRGRLRYFYGPLKTWQDDFWETAGDNAPYVWGLYCLDKLRTQSNANRLQWALFNQARDYFRDFMPWENEADDRYPESEMRVGFFRSKANSSQLYWVDSIDNDAGDLKAEVLSAVTPVSWEFEDNMLGVPSVSANSHLSVFPACTPAPFVDGQVELDGAPPMLGLFEGNGVLFGIGAQEVKWNSPVVDGTDFGGWDRSYEVRTERVRQSVPGLPDIWPRSFYVDLDGDCLAGGSINGQSFAMSSFRTYRLDGVYDQFGAGSLRKKLLADGVGCSNPASVLRFGQILYWLADDGFYGTDGVNVSKVSKNLRTTFLNRTCKNATSDPANRRLFWVLSNGTFVLFPDFGVEEEHRAFFKWDGPQFLNSCVMVDGASVYRGRTDGYVVLHGSTEVGDCDVAFEANYRTPFVGFGDPVSAKSQPRVDVLASNKGNPYTIHLQSYKDSQFGGGSTPQYINVSGAAAGSEGPFTGLRGVVPFKRYLKSNDLRCHTRSVRLSVRGPSLDGGDMTLTYQGEVGGFPTFKFSGVRPTTVVVGTLLYPEGNLVPLEICAVSSDTVSCRTGGSWGVGYVLSSWAIFGPIPADVSLFGIVMHCAGGNDDLQGGES